MEDKDKLSEIEVKLKEWERGILKQSLEVSPEREIASELPKKRLYTPLDMVDFDYSRDLGFPGEPPFVRGYSPAMYRSRLWDMGEYAGYGSPEDAHARYSELLSAGGEAVSIACDLPSQLGYDADNPLAEAEVGLTGVSCCSLSDVEAILADIPMDKTPLIGSVSTLHLVFWAMYVAVAAKRGIPSEQLSGQATIDCLQEFISRGTYIFPPEHAVRLSLDTMEYALKHIPGLTYQVNPYAIHEAGATVVQEAAYALAVSLYFLEAAHERGMDVEALAKRFTIHTAMHTNLFEEVAKLRAIKRMWAKLMKERFNPKDPNVMRVRIGAHTGGSPLTAQDPETNIIRVTIAALAGALAGATRMATSSFDEAHAIPSAKAVKIALRTLQIIGYESGVADVMDPLGGSYYVESLTSELEKRAFAYLEKIEDRGGIVQVTESGWMQQEIAHSAYIRQKEIDEGKRVIVGVNKFVSDEKPALEIHKARPEIVKEQKIRLEKLRRERDNEAVQASLEKVRKTAQGKENLMPVVIEAVGNYATLEEVCGILREVFGEYEAFAMKT